MIMISVDLEMAYEERSPSEAIRRLEDQYGVLIRVIDYQHQADWPMVRITGTPANVAKIVAEAWECGDGGEFFIAAMASAKPVYDEEAVALGSS